jgi:hypothetical protein
MSKFRDWQATRKEISLQQLRENSPTMIRELDVDEFVPDEIFSYDSVCGYGKEIYIARQGCRFASAINGEFFSSELLEILEMRLFLWAYGLSDDSF